MGRTKTTSSVIFSRNTDEWRTPLDLFDKLNSKYHFDLGPCSTDENALCKKHFTKEQDGLQQSWAGHHVFVNPPYGNVILWAQKCYFESRKNPGTICVLLVPSRTDTKWFHEYVYHKARLEFIRGRLFFGNAKNHAPFPSMLAIYGEDTNEEVRTW